MTPGRGKEFAEFRRGGDLLLRAAAPPVAARHQREHQRPAARVLPEGGPTSPRSRTRRSSGCTMPSTAGPASAWGSGRPTRSTTQRCCTCSENSRVEILSRTNPSTGLDSTATLFPSVVSYIQMDDRSAFRNLTYLGSLCFGDSRSRRKLARSSNEFGSRRIGTPASGLRDADRCSQGSGARSSTR